MKLNALFLSLFILFFYSTFIQAQTYCPSSANLPWEQWNTSVTVANRIGSTTFQTPVKSGYGNYTNLSPAKILRGENNLITITPASSWSGDPNNMNLSFSVSIDFNGDGVFALLYGTNISFQNGIFSNTSVGVVVPSTARLGNTRMRISMKVGSIPQACETFDRGEVQDFTVQIIDGGQINNLPACAQLLGNGKVLCFNNNSANTTVLYLADGNNNITQKVVDKNVTAIRSTPLGSLVRDSIFVKNNQVIKKLANGSIAYTKNIPPSVLNRAPLISTATEMNNGSFVLAGFQKNISTIRDSLVLIATDANLAFQNIFVDSLNPYIQGGGDTVLQLIPISNSQFVVEYYYGIDASSFYYNGGIFVPYHSFTKFQTNGTSFQKLKNVDYNNQLFSQPILTTVCGNNLIMQNHSSSTFIYSAHNDTINSIFNLDSLFALSEKDVGGGFARYYGVYSNYNYSYRPTLRDSAFQITAGYAGDRRTNMNDFSTLEIKFYNNNSVSTHSKFIPFIAFDHIIRTGDTTCLVVASVNGQTWIYNPDCNNTQQPLPDLTLANLNLTTNSVEQGKVLSFKVDIKNIGTGNAPGNFIVRAYISKDNVLSADDVQDGIIPTGNFAAGFSVSQVHGSSTIPATLAPGSYFLILKVDADDQVIESNENNNVIASSAPFTVTTAQPGIALSIAASPVVFTKFTNLNFTVTARNNGNQNFTNVKIEFKFPAGTVNGGLATPTSGSWSEWCAGGVQCFTWSLPSFAPNASAALVVPVFVLSPASPIVATTKILSSMPSSNTSTTINVIGAPSSIGLQQLQSTQFIPIVIEQIAPNPTDGELKIILNSLDNREINLNFSDAFGKTVKSETRNVEKGINQLSFDVSELPQGVYLISHSTNSGLNLPTKFVKM